MRIFVAGATGAIGRQLVPALVGDGHEVVGMTRSNERARVIRDMGAKPAIADALDADAVRNVMVGARPEVVVHQLTALADALSERDVDKAFAPTNRLRTAGTDHLLAAAREVGATRFVAQSYAGWPFARTGGPVKTEEDPLDPDPPGPARTSLAAIRHLEQAVTEAEGLTGVVLRYGNFYGSGTSIAVAPDGEHVRMVKKRMLPIIGRGTGIWSFIHIADAAHATVAAIERGDGGVYQVVDDEPAPVSEWLPVLAQAVGAKPPFRVPRWLGRILVGEMVVNMMTEIRGASNAKAKRELGWMPLYTSWRQGFATALT